MLISTYIKMLEIDGSVGGGQVLRTALIMSMITEKPFHIFNIRKNRPHSGLKPQHKKIIDTLLDCSDSTCNKYDHGTSELYFYPGKITKFKLVADIGTAGSITLFLQTILTTYIIKKKRLKIKVFGGTDVAFSPSIDYFDNVILSHYSRFSKIKSKICKRGYYPKGGGEYEINVKPVEYIKELDMTNFGKIEYVHGIIHASSDLMKVKVCERVEKVVHVMLSEHNLRIQMNYSSTLSTGVGITLWGVNSINDDINEPIVYGVDVLGKKGMTSENLAKIACNKIINLITSRIPCDEHLADNMQVLLNFYKGKLKALKETDHIKANNYVIKKFNNGNLNFALDYLS